MRDPLILAAAQPPCVAYDAAANAAIHAAAVRAAGARAVVFPQLSLTGEVRSWSIIGALVILDLG